MNRKYVLLISFVFMLGLISALPIVVMPLNDSGYIQPDTSFLYTWNFTNNGDCTDIVYSNTSTIITDSYGRGFIDLNLGDMTEVPNYLCEYINGTFRKLFELDDQVFRNSFTKNLLVNGKINSTGSIFSQGINLTALNSTGLIINWSTVIDITNYAQLSEILNFNYYNSTDFNINNYYLSSNPFGFYNSTDFVILDYFTKTQILNLNYFNTTNFPYTSLSNFSNDLGIGNWTLDKPNYVPYSGATGNINLETKNITNLTSFTLNGGQPITWNSDYYTLNIPTGLGNTLQVGQEMTLIRKNNAGQTIYAGQLVYESGSQGEIITVDLADASNGSKLSHIGMVTIPSCNNNAMCPINYFGDVHDLDTSAYAEGTMLYVSDDGSGNVTSTLPSGNSYHLAIGKVSRSHASSGIIAFNVELDIGDEPVVNNFKVLNNLNVSGLIYGNGSQLNTNSSNYWDGLNSPANIALNDLSSTLTSSQIFTLGGNTIQWRFTNPVGGIVYNWTGAASGHLFTLKQTGNSIPPGAINHLLHIESEDSDVLDLHIHHTAGTGEAFRVQGGYGNFTDSLYINETLVNIWLYNQTIPAINEILSFNYYNSTTLTSLSQLSDDLGNRGYTHLSNFTNDLSFLTEETNWNENYSTFLNIASWNNTGLIKNWSIDTSIFYLNSNPFNFYNSTTIGSIPNTNNYWNATFATFNKTYADTIYRGISNNTFYGNVGIGTDSPNESLEVVGNLRLTNTFTAGESLSPGDLTYLKSDGKFWKADADNVTTSKGLLAICLDTISADANGSFMLRGKYTTSGLTIASEYFISTDVGTWNETIPSDSGDVVRLIGYALSTTELYFDTDKTYVEIA